MKAFKVKSGDFKLRYSEIAKLDIASWHDAKKLYLYERRNLAEKTLYSYRRAIDVFEEFFTIYTNEKIQSVSQIERHYFASYLEYLNLKYERADKTISYKTLCKNVKQVKFFFLWLKNSGADGEYIKYLDMLQVNMKKPNNRIVMRHTLVFEVDELSKFLYELDSEVKNISKIKLDNPAKYRNYKQLHVIIMFLATCGMRISEICYLKLGKIVRSGDKKNVVIDIRVKGGKQISMKINNSLGELILNHIEEFCKNNAQDSYVFYGENPNVPININNVRLLVKKITKKIGITRKITPHSFRATLATYMHVSGYNVSDIQAILGHENQEQTKEYINSLSLIDATKFDIFSSVGFIPDKTLSIYSTV